MKGKLYKHTCTIVDCLVVGLICSYVLVPKMFIHTSNTVLGRFLAVLLIAYYSHKNSIYGIAACAVIIVFYFHHVNDKNIYQKETFINTELLSESTTQFHDFLPKAHPKIENGLIEPRSNTIHTTIDTAYPDHLSKVCPESEKIFREDHCKVNNVVTYKNVEVSNEMIPHVFEIEYADGTCNPCDSHCRFTVRKKKHEILEELEPQNTRDVPDFIPEQIKKLGLFNNSGEPFTGIKDGVASFLI
jgi:hypothetical protein